MKKIMVEEIRYKLIKHYGAKAERNLTITPVTDSLVLFSLSGSDSPPKGYALYVPGRHELWYYDAWGRRFRIVRNVSVEVEEQVEEGKHHEDESDLLELL